MGRVIEFITLLVTLFLIGIPTAADFYPPLFSGLASQIPLSPILTWMARLGLVTLGGLLGWVLRGWSAGSEPKKSVGTVGNSDSIKNDLSLDSIKGCVNLDGACWEGELIITNGKWDFIDVRDNPLCSNCRTPLQGKNTTTMNYSSTWECSSCGKSYQYSLSSTAKDHFEKHFRKIWESEGEKYSLPQLQEKYREEENGETPSPKDIWRQYVSVSTGEEPSICCFY